MLWGLARMGFRWSTDFLRPVKSLATGAEVIPLGHSLIRYLRQHMTSLSEHEFSVLLYSLGELRMPWDKLSTKVAEMMYNQTVRLSRHLRARSTANALYGLSQCGIVWSSMPNMARDAWVMALVNCGDLFDSNSASDQIDKEFNDTSTFGNISNEKRLLDKIGVVEDISSAFDKPKSVGKGIQSMNAGEVSQTVYSLGVMQMPWSQSSPILKASIIREVVRSCMQMSPYGRSACLSGMSMMNCVANDVPQNLIAAVVNDILNLDDKGLSNLRVLNKDQSVNDLNKRYFTTMKAIIKLQLPLSNDTRHRIQAVYESVVNHDSEFNQTEMIIG